MDLCDSSSSPEARDGLRILIVEDLADSAQSTALLLRLYGHQVTISADGFDGVELARSEKPDVVLIDIGLPGMDGHAVARKISETRERRCGSPLLASAKTLIAIDRRKRGSICTC
jgi:CheY-like chemotaxis protein